MFKRFLERRSKPGYVETEKEAKESKRLMQYVQLQAKVKKQFNNFEAKYAILNRFPYSIEQIL